MALPTGAASRWRSGARAYGSGVTPPALPQRQRRAPPRRERLKVLQAAQDVTGEQCITQPLGGETAMALHAGRVRVIRRRRTAPAFWRPDALKRNREPAR